MGLIEEINQMKNQGMDEKEISDNLQEKGVAPKSINDAFNQMKIKNAISSEQDESMRIPEENSGIMKTGQNLYQPKTMEIGNYQRQNMYVPEPQEEMRMSESAPQNYVQEEYSPQEGYENYETGEAGYYSDNLIEIAEQVFTEKIKKIEKQVEVLNEFATLAETKISNNHERIKRVETIMDKLQVAILEKIGSYGKNIEGIKKELEMMQDSFGKMTSKLHEKNSEHHSTHHKTKKK